MGTDLKKPLFLLFFLCASVGGWCQEVTSYTREDFDLKGPVASCFVFTKYGQEQYFFNRSGLLVKAATVFGEDNSETAYYQYDQGKLMERRLEYYVNGVLDKMTSMANFYTYDSTPNLEIKEKIINYNRAFIEQFNYRYDSIGQLKSLVRTNTEGRVISLVRHQWDSLGTQKTSSYWLDSIPTKQLDSVFKNKNGALSQVQIKTFLDGVPNALEEKIFDSKGMEVQNNSYYYALRDSLIQVVKSQSVKKVYNAQQLPISVVFEKGVVRQKKQILYQLDGSVHKNWIKKITTPDNTYTTRKITYFDPVKD